MDIIALAVSVGALVVSVVAVFYPVYVTEWRLADDLTATVVGLNPSTDTNGFYTVEMSLMVRNEGNREVVVPMIALELSETTTFDLVVRHHWSRSSPISIEAKKTVHKTIAFGEGRQKYHMIESKEADTWSKGIGAPSMEPVIHARLGVQSVDSRGKVHEEKFAIGRLQRGNGLRLMPEWKAPYTLTLLPSRASEPKIGLSAGANESMAYSDNGRCQPSVISTCYQHTAASRKPREGF